MYDLISIVGNFSYNLAFNQSTTESLVLFPTTLVTFFATIRTHDSTSLIGKATHYSALITHGLSYHLLGIAQTIRMYHFTSEPLCNISASVLSNFSPEVSEKISEYGLGTVFALSLPIIGYGFMNKKKWTIVPAMGLTLVATHKVTGMLVGSS